MKTFLFLMTLAALAVTGCESDRDDNGDHNSYNNGGTNWNSGNNNWNTNYNNPNKNVP